MAPDGVRALRAAAGLLALAGVHRLEVVDVAVRLVEVAVAVVVVAIPDVELRQVRVDLRRRACRRRSAPLYQAFSESRTNSQVRAQMMLPQ